MDLHAWITQQVDATEAEAHAVLIDPAAVLRRCEADRRILARHRADPAAANTTRAAACDGCGVEWVQDYCEPFVDNLNNCPELLDLAHAHGITPDILAGLDRPTPPEPQPRDGRRLGLVANTPPDRRAGFAGWAIGSDTERSPDE